MIYIDFKKFIYDRVWFGWVYSPGNRPPAWYRGTNPNLHWKIVIREEVRYSWNNWNAPMR